MEKERMQTDNDQGSLTLAGTVAMGISTAWWGADMCSATRLPIRSGGADRILALLGGNRSLGGLHRSRTSLRSDEWTERIEEPLAPPSLG